MRPINAETLKASMILDGLTMMLLGKKYELSDAMKTVDHAPTIALEPKKGLPPAEAIPISWIEERIINAEDAGQDVLARMWRELINGYRREMQKK